MTFSTRPIPTPEAVKAGWNHPPPRSTNYKQLDALAEHLIQDQGSKGCHHSDLKDNLRTLAKMTQPTPITGDSSSTYPVFGIDCDGVVYVSRKIIKAYTGASSFLTKIEDALHLFHKGEREFLYGRTIDNSPTVFQVVKVTEDRQDLPTTLRMFNPMYRAKGDLTILQRVTDSVNRASGKATFDISTAFDKHEYTVCEVGLQVHVAYQRFARRSGISRKFLEKLGFEEFPIQDYLQDLILAYEQPAEGAESEMIVYPEVTKRVKRPKRSAGKAMLETCASDGFSNMEECVMRVIAGDKIAPEELQRQISNRTEVFIEKEMAEEPPDEDAMET